MASVNKVILVGNLGKDPEMRYLTDGGKVVNLTLATNSSWKDKATGQKREETEWHRVVFYGRQAEIAAEYCKKGSTIYVEGRLKTRKWQDQSGVDRYTTEIVGDVLQLLGGRDSNAQNVEASAKAYANKQPARQQDMRNPGSISDMEDDIPF